MLRAVRRQLRRIEYYSATRRRTVWTRATDIGLLLTFVFAVPAVWMCNRGVTRVDSAEVWTGRLGANPDGTVAALIIDDPQRRLSWPGERPLGEFTVTVVRDLAGWPFTTSVRRQPPALDLNLFDEPDQRLDVRLAADDPTRAAVEAALTAAGRADLADLWRSGAVEDEHAPLAWIAATLVWTVLLMVAVIVVVPVARVTTHLVRFRRLARRVDLKRTGHCAECGYDLRGLEFSARCPECGTVQT